PGPSGCLSVDHERGHDTWRDLVCWRHPCRGARLPCCLRRETLVCRIFVSAFSMQFGNEFERVVRQLAGSRYMQLGQLDLFPRLVLVGKPAEQMLDYVEPGAPLVVRSGNVPGR